VGRNIRRHKIDAAELKTFFRRPRQRHMPEMNRIEASAKQANVHVFDPDLKA
jgi:hypothetical protein